MQHIHEPQLLIEAQQGNEVAINDLFHVYSQRLALRIAAMFDSRLSARLDPADVMQEALLRAYMYLPDYLNQRPIAFLPWLIFFVRRELIRLHRQHLPAQCRSVLREQCTRWSNSQCDPVGNSRAGGWDLPGSQAVLNEQRDRLRDALQALPNHQWEILSLRYEQGMKIDEIAQQLQISLEAAKLRLKRARQAVGKVLAELPG